MIPTMKSLQPYLLSLLRVVSALVLFSDGTQKIPRVPYVDGVPPVGSLAWIAGRDTGFGWELY